MSEMLVQALKDASGGNEMSVPDLNQGRSKAWVNFNGTGTVAVRDSFNISSIVDNGTGDYSQNVTAPFANANYCFTSNFGGTSGIVGGRTLEDSTARTATLIRFAVFNSVFANADAAWLSADTKGDA